MKDQNKWAFQEEMEEGESTKLILHIFFLQTSTILWLSDFISITMALKPYFCSQQPVCPQNKTNQNKTSCVKPFHTIHSQF